MKKNLVFVLVAALMLSMLLGACGGKAAHGENESVRLSVVTSYGGDDGNRQNYETSYREWEDKTGNSIADSSAASNEEWKAKVNTDFATGTEPDVLFFFTGSDADSIVKSGKVVSLDEIRAEYPGYGSNMNPALLPISPADGKQYTLPATGFWEALFVNKAILEEVGVAMPGADYRWDQFLADCQRIKDAGYTPIAVSLQEVPHYWWEYAIFNNGGVETHLDIPAGSNGLAASESPAGEIWGAGLTDIKALYDRGFFPENTLTAADVDTVQLMYDGKAAFLIDGSWKIGAFLENVPDGLDRYAVTYVPGKGSRKASDIVGGISMGYYITKKAWGDPDRRVAAVSFVEYMTSEAVLAKFSKNGVSPTALKEIPVENGMVMNAFVKSAADMFAGQTDSSSAVQDLLTGAARDEMFSNIKNIVSGTRVPADLIDKTIKLNAE
jgi:raffinose/stachyose/melibiose transport system substrate-binding protein